ALTDSAVLPIKTHASQDNDALSSIVTTLSKLESQEQMWIQVMARPVNDDWHNYSKQWVDGVKSGSLLGGGNFDMRWLGDMFASLWRPPQGGGMSAPRALSDRESRRCNAAETKAQKTGFKVRLRIAYLGNSQSTAKMRTQALMGAFKQFSQADINGFKVGKASFSKEDLSRYKSRLFIGGGFVLNTEELATVFHLPHSGLATLPMTWSASPASLPDSEIAEQPTALTHTLPILTGNQAIDENISAFGLTNSHGIEHQFGLLRADRSRHVYIIGQTGTGKTATLELLSLSDLYHHQGYAIIDPHGDFAVNNLRFIPGSRLKDVIYFNPADTAWPLGFNPLEVTN